MTFGLRLPDAPRLLGRLALRGGAAAGGRARVSVTDRSGETRVLLDRGLSELAGGPGAAIDADLSGLAGPFVALNLAYSLTGEAPAQAPPELAWRSLRIAGERRAPRAPEPRIARGPYNVVVLLQIAGRPLWWFLLMFVPFVNIIVTFVVVMDIARAFGRSAGFGIGLFFLGFVFYPILGFGDSEYEGAPAH